MIFFGLMSLNPSLEIHPC